MRRDQVDPAEPGAADREALAALGLEVAREAAGLVVGRRRDGVSVADTKSSITDLVTEADRASEELIRERLLAARPDDGVLGEEGDDVEARSGVRWIVDPIDGTVNYVLGLPAYAVSIAAALVRPAGDEVVAGVVVNPATGEEYVATLGGGARLDGVPLSARATPSVERAVVSTGFSYERDVRARQAEAVAQLLGRVADIRRFGSCALDLCALAAGRSDGYVEEGVRPWDHAAGGLIAREAGAQVALGVGASGADLVVAAPAAVFGAFSRVVEECGFGRLEAGTGAP